MVPGDALGFCGVCVCAPILFASFRRMFFRPHFLFSFRKGNGVEPPKEKRAWGNLSNGFPTPLLATKGLALGTCYVWKSEMHDGVSERRCAERGALSDGRDGWDGQRKTEIF